jgi:hypothetical protein
LVIENNFNYIKKFQIFINKYYLSTEIINIFATLYDNIRNGYIRPQFGHGNNIFSTLGKGVCICSIGKNENLYIKEFIDYYLLSGVKKIIIYDNNDINGENFKDIIQDNYSKRVEIIDVRGMTSIQIPIYNYCYKNNYNRFDWIGFFDFDEYLYIKKNSNINSFLSNKRFEKCELVFFNWMIYNDNNLMKYDNRALSKRFKKPKSFHSQGKSFVRGGNNKLLIPSTHIPGINVHSFCNSKGEKIYPKNFFNNKIENSPLAYIKHYYTKTVEEFCNKINKGHAHFHKKHPYFIQSIKSRIDFFFRLNKITEEKIEILEKCTKLNLKNYKNKLKSLL